MEKKDIKTSKQVNELGCMTCTPGQNLITIIRDREKLAINPNETLKPN